MKIGFIGNTNNFPFMLAMAMRRLGNEVVFIVDRKDTLHRPEHRYQEITYPYPDWIHDCSDVVSKYHHYLYPKIFLRKVVSLLVDCDSLIVNGLWPILANSWNKPYFVLLTGSDLETYADFDAATQLSIDSSSNTSVVKTALRKIIMNRIVVQQRLGLKNANGCNYFPKGVIENGDSLLDEINLLGKRTAFMMTDVSNLQPLPPPDNPIPRILCTARLNWVKPYQAGHTELDYKGTDILLRGFSLFIRGGGHMRLTLVRKGLHISETQALTHALQLEEHVDWLDEMSQVALFDQYLQHDIIADHFSSSVVGMAGLDAMALGRPLIANARPEIFEPVIGEKTAICHAATPDDVCAQLIKLSDVDVRIHISNESRDYVLRKFSTDNAARICSEVLLGQNNSVVL